MNRGDLVRFKSKPPWWPKKKPLPTTIYQIDRFAPSGNPFLGPFNIKGHKFWREVDRKYLEVVFSI